MRLSHVTRNESTVHVPVGDEKLEVRYRPGAFTPHIEDELNELGGGAVGATGRRFCELICRIVTGWDLEEDNGAPVPLQPERLMELPARFLADVLQAIGADMQPGEAQGSSVVGSPPTAALEPARTGTNSSTRPATSASLPGL